MKSFSFILPFILSFCNFFTSLPLCACFLSFCPAYSQVIINEVCSRNGALIRDEDGDFDDWIELYNSGITPVSILNYSITDDSSLATKWIFPAVSIPSKGFLTLFASGKDRKVIVNHWETAVFANDQWRYIVPTSPPDTTWFSPLYDDAAWSTGNGGIGYGDGDDNTLIIPPAYSLFMRRSFFISDTSKIISAILNIDYDDAFVAYLNGVEIARGNIGETGKPPPYDQLAFKEREAIMYQGMFPENIKIEPDFLKMITFNGMNVLSIQVHNVSPNSSDMTCRAWLTFGIKDNTILFSTPPVWFDGGKGFLHTNFKLNGDGETVSLYSATQQLVNSLAFPYTQIDNSFGCYPDGMLPSVYFGSPTPDFSNNGVTPFSGYASDPVFSLPAGFYNGNQTLVLSTTFPGGQIRFTSDGSFPNDFSPLYLSPILLDTTKVIRARVYSTSALGSEALTNTYFINESSTLPVISLSTTPGNLFDWFTGIYVMGPDADTISPYFGANFWQDWEIPGHIEYFDKQKIQKVDQDIGLEIFGNYSRSNPQKSFKVVASGRYGPGSLDYQFFPGKNISSFEQIALRNAGNDWNVLHFRDAFMHKLCIGTTDLDVQDYQPALVFINGEYWGVYNIREKINKDYVAENHGVEADSIDLLQYNGYVMSGNINDFNNFGTFVISNDMSDSANYAVVKNWLDIENFADYFAIETWSENGDWLANNVRYWRERKAGAKWRHILWDLDFFGTAWWWPFTANSLDTNMKKIDGFKGSYQSILFVSLVQNTEFREYFINRYADLINTLLQKENLKKFAIAIRDSIDPEMPRQFKRWGFGYDNPAFGNPGQGGYDEWRLNNFNQLIYFFNNRNITARNHIQEVFTLKQQVPLTLDVYPPGAGTIRINTVQPDSFPWGGVYFDSVPVTITAIPNPGYQFAFWQSNTLIPSPDFNASVRINVDTFDVFTAYFFGAPDTDRITISEINYKSDTAANAGDWVEIHNYGTTDMELSGWVFKDGNDANTFALPAATKLNSGNYLVLCADSVLFSTQHPGISNFTGRFTFGLSATGENLRLFDNSGSLRVSAAYSATPPWPGDVNGTGKTLELLDPYGNLNSSANWFSGCTGGSPGGAFNPCPVAIDEIQHSTRYRLTNYPNPFTDKTTISFILDKSTRVRLNLIDVTGKISTTVSDQYLIAGEHRFAVSLMKISSGIYFYQIITPEGTETRQMEAIR